jgi:hypothetical protein
MNQFVKSDGLKRLHRASGIEGIDYYYVEQFGCGIQKRAAIGYYNMRARICKTGRQLWEMGCSGVFYHSVYFNHRCGGYFLIFHDFPEASAVAAAYYADARRLAVHKHGRMDNGFVIYEFVAFGKNHNICKTENSSKAVSVEYFYFLKGRSIAEHSAFGPYGSARKSVYQIFDPQ